MKKTAIGALLAAPPVIAGSVFLAPTHRVVHADYKLVNDALITSRSTIRSMRMPPQICTLLTQLQVADSVLF